MARGHNIAQDATVNELLAEDHFHITVTEQDEANRHCGLSALEIALERDGFTIQGQPFDGSISINGQAYEIGVEDKANLEKFGPGEYVLVKALAEPEPDAGLCDEELGEAALA